MSDDISIPSPTYRVPRHRRGMDVDGKRRMVIAASLAGGLAVVAVGWSMLGHRSHSVPVVQADSSPVRVKPANPGGLQVAGAGNEIFSGGNDTTVDKLAPPPEVPDPQALKAVAPPPAPVLKPVETPALASAPPAPPRPPAAADAAPRQAANADIAPKPAPVATAAPAAAAADRHPAPPHAVKGPLVQLAALSTEPAAKVEWERLSHRLPDLLGGRQPAISKIERDGHTFWRVRTGGFSDIAQATVFCERVRAKGGGCSVADF